MSVNGMYNLNCIYYIKGTVVLTSSVSLHNITCSFGRQLCDLPNDFQLEIQMARTCPNESFGLAKLSFRTFEFLR